MTGGSRLVNAATSKDQSAATETLSNHSRNKAVSQISIRKVVEASEKRTAWVCSGSNLIFPKKSSAKIYMSCGEDGSACSSMGTCLLQLPPSPLPPPLY